MSSTIAALESADEISDVVYSPQEMADNKPPTVAVLSDRVATAIKVFSFLGIAAIAAIVGVGAFLNNRGSEHGERLAKIEGKLEGLIKSVDRLLDREAKNLLKIPGQSPEDIKNAAARLRERKITVSFEEIHKASEALLQNSDQGSWGALMQLASLRSFVNSTITEAKQHIGQTIGPSSHGKWWEGSPGDWTLIVDQTLILDAKDQNELPHINDGSGNPARSYKNIISKNCHLIYHSREISLADVFFEDCTFDIEHTHNGERLAKSILAPVPFTTFAAD